MLHWKFPMRDNYCKFSGLLGELEVEFNNVKKEKNKKSFRKNIFFFFSSFSRFLTFSKKKGKIPKTQKCSRNEGK